MKIFDLIGNFFLKSRLRLLLIVAVIVALFVYLVIKQRPDSGLPETGAPQVPTQVKVNQQQLTSNKSRLISTLPHQGDGFTVEYFPDRDYFFIEINKNPYNTYKTSAEDWLGANGVEPTLVNIKWGSTRGVAP